MHRLDLNYPIWDQFFLVAPLVVIGSVDCEGEINFAPKHMAFPMGWDNYFGFICAPTHRTQVNIREHRYFTVSYPRPDQVLLAALAASPCQGEVDKTEVLARLDSVPAQKIEGRLLRDASLHLECSLESMTVFGRNTLVVGKILAAAAHPGALRHSDEDDLERIHEHPLLAYLSPGRYATIRHSSAFPFPRGFQK